MYYFFLIGFSFQAANNRRVLQGSDLEANKPNPRISFPADLQDYATKAFKVGGASLTNATFKCRLDLATTELDNQESLID